jgi:hypothetical protein
MDFDLAILTNKRVFADSGNDYAELRSSQRMRFFFGEKPVAKFALVTDESGTAYEINETDTFEISGDIDKVHAQSAGTLSAAYSGAVVEISMALTTAPSRTSGSLLLRNAANQRERVAYTAYTGTGPYVFTVDKTLDYVYASGDYGAVADDLMFYCDDVTIDTVNNTIQFDGIDCFTLPFEDKLTSDPLDIYVEVKRWVSGETRPRILAQGMAYALGAVRDVEGAGAASATAYAEMDNRYVAKAASLMTGYIRTTGIITPTELAADADDYAPTGAAAATVLRLSADAAHDITGLAGGSDGRILYLHNVGAETITLKAEDASSAAANRFAISADFELEANAVALLQYDDTSDRWRVIGGAGGSSTVSEITGGLKHTGFVYTDPQLSGQQDDLDLTIADVVVVSLIASEAIDITGLAGGVTGKHLMVINNGNYAITLKYQNGSSLSANQFWPSLNEDLVLNHGDGCILWYSGSKWRVVASTVSQPKSIFIDSLEMLACTTAPAAAGTKEYDTDKPELRYFAFDSGATKERVQFRKRMPINWTLNKITAKFYWSSAASSTAGDTVEWGIKAVALRNHDAIAAAFGTPQVISDTLLADNGGDMQISPATPALTIGGTPAAGAMACFEVYRNTDGTDDMTEDAWLFGVELIFG